MVLAEWDMVGIGVMVDAVRLVGAAVMVDPAVGGEELLAALLADPLIHVYPVPGPVSFVQLPGREAMLVVPALPLEVGGVILAATPAMAELAWVIAVERGVRGVGIAVNMGLIDRG